MKKAFKYRIYPTRGQAEAMDGQVDEACRLYNAALQERKEAWRMTGTSLNYYDQANQLKEIRACGDLGLANYSACQDVLRRVDKAFQAFFRRVKAGKKAGFPRFKARSRFDSYIFPAYGDGCKLRDDGKLYIQGIGALKVKLHRPVSGQIKTVTLKREAGRWHVCFSMEMPALEPLPTTVAATGIDVGLESFAVLSDGSVVENPRSPAPQPVETPGDLTVDSSHLLLAFRLCSPSQAKSGSLFSLPIFILPCFSVECLQSPWPDKLVTTKTTKSGLRQ